MRTLNRLSTLKVSGLKGKGMYADGGGLYLRVGESGTKGWIFRFGENGKLHDMGLGPLHTINLARRVSWLRSAVSSVCRASIR